jgi:hypothetical protein
LPWKGGVMIVGCPPRLRRGEWPRPREVGAGYGRQPDRGRWSFRTSRPTGMRSRRSRCGSGSSTGTEVPSGWVTRGSLRSSGLATRGSVRASGPTSAPGASRRTGRSRSSRPTWRRRRRIRTTHRSPGRCTPCARAGTRRSTRSPPGGPRTPRSATPQGSPTPQPRSTTGRSRSEVCARDEGWGSLASSHGGLGSIGSGSPPGPCASRMTGVRSRFG